MIQPVIRFAFFFSSLFHFITFFSAKSIFIRCDKVYFLELINNCLLLGGSFFNRKKFPDLLIFDIMASLMLSHSIEQWHCKQSDSLTNSLNDVNSTIIWLNYSIEWGNLVSHLKIWLETRRLQRSDEDDVMLFLNSWDNWWLMVMFSRFLFALVHFTKMI